jgi:hypothetical protein
LAAGKSNPLSAGYKPVGSAFAFAAIKGNTHPEFAPGKIGFAECRPRRSAGCGEICFQSFWNLSEMPNIRDSPSLDVPDDQ